MALSLDDFYLTKDARQRLAREVHPLLATRGPPGTHDVGMAGATIDALRAKSKATLPRFDKASDTRAPRNTWQTFASPVDVILLEGWCVGAVSQGEGGAGHAGERPGARRGSQGRLGATMSTTSSTAPTRRLSPGCTT